MLYEMSVMEERIFTVSCGSGTKVWKFSSDDVTVVDDVQVVALNYLNSSIRNFIIQDSDTIKQAAKYRLTCTTMKGYRDLMERRGAVQSAMYTHTPEPVACTLFSKPAAKASVKRAKVAMAPQLLDVRFPFRGQEVTVRMKSSENNRECLHVEFDKAHPVALHRVIDYIRDMGFEKVGVNEIHVNHQEIPQGIWKRKNKDESEFFIVRRLDGKYSKCLTLPEALVAKDAEPDGDGEEVPSPSHDDAQPAPSPTPASSPAPEPSPLESHVDGDTRVPVSHEGQHATDSDSDDDPCKIVF